jgi:hypothetical protein
MGIPAKKSASTKAALILDKPVMGRPKIYTDEVIQQEADALVEWIKDKKNTYIGVFAAERGYDRARLSEFARSNDYFSRAYKSARQWQENIFTNNALTRLWDPGFTARVMARVCIPEWKNSWDQPEEKSDSPTTVIINKIEK